jgi:hypothetical protein
MRRQGLSGNNVSKAAMLCREETYLYVRLEEGRHSRRTSFVFVLILLTATLTLHGVLSARGKSERCTTCHPVMTRDGAAQTQSGQTPILFGNAYIAGSSASACLP